MQKAEYFGCDDVLNLGIAKPMGYLPLPFFGKWTSLTIADVKPLISAAGLRYSERPPEECCIKGGALYAWSPVALVELLDRHEDLLEGAGWPKDPENFVSKCAREWVTDEHPIRAVIAQAFGNAWEIDPA